jgi:hypothetical protein
VTYSVTPAYTAGDSGTFTITAVADEGFVLTGDTSFTVNVPAKKVCDEGTEGGNPPAAPASPAPSAEVPNTAMELPAASQGSLLVAMIGVGGLAVLAGSTVMAASRRRR